MQASNLGKPDAEFKLLLHKDMYVDPAFNIEITYKGIFGLNIPHQSMLSEDQLIWRYEQFLYFDAYQSHQVKDKLFMHQIEWVGGTIWSIIARDVRVLWV